jgi:transposase-like protein
LASSSYDPRKKKTLSPLIKNHIKAHTIITSDQFTSYVSTNLLHILENNRMLKSMKYTHKWVNHSKHFVDPDTGACTNRIEGTWEVRIKHKHKKMRGIDKHLLPSYLDEYLWRSWYFDGTVSPSEYFEGLVAGIKKYYCH